MGDASGAAVGSCVGVSAESVLVGEGVSVGAIVVLAVAVVVALDFSDGVLTVELLNGPPSTVTTLVCACPYVPSPRTEVAPSGTNVGTWTLIFALPVLLVTTEAMSA